MTISLTDPFLSTSGITHAYAYTAQNRLLSLQITNSTGFLLRGYIYSLDATGNRVGVVESANSNGTAVQRRRVSYEYDQGYFGNPTPARVYRLTSENIYNDVNNPTGGITNIYDNVGNRTSRYVGSVPPSSLGFGDQSFSFDKRDQLSMYFGAYDLNGNTIVDENGTTNGDFYDAENHLIVRTNASITIGYDFEGNRVWKRVGTATTYYLLDDRNPSGYVQVLAEYSATNSAPDRLYAYGLELISLKVNNSTLGLPASTNYFCFDGQGSVRLLAGLTGAVTNVYDYDAFGMPLTVSEGVTNNYRYTGQQWDPDLRTYFLRARYLNPNTGRFWTMDTYEGDQVVPLSLHKYLYCRADPIGLWDPTGHDGDEISLLVSGEISAGLSASSAAATVTAETSAEVSVIASETAAQVNEARAVLQTAFEAEDGTAIGRAFQTFGRIAETAARNTIKIAVDDSVEVVSKPAAREGGRRFLDFALKQGPKLLKLEVKYNLPQKGAALTRLAAQVEESVAASDGGTTVVWSFRAPTQAAIKAVQQALGSNYSKVVFKSGIRDLLVYLRTFF